MKPVDAFRTADGVLHDSFRAAKSHAEKRYGDCLTRLAHEMLRCEKYVAMTDYLDTNTDRFAELLMLKADCELPERKDHQLSHLDD
jgi:hypothetical protein